MAGKRKELRELKVSSFCCYGRKEAPMLRLQGQWLEELGFRAGDTALVKCEDGRLIITVDEKMLYQQVAEKEVRYEA